MKRDAGTSLGGSGGTSERNTGPLGTEGREIVYIECTLSCGNLISWCEMYTGYLRIRLLQRGGCAEKPF